MTRRSWLSVVVVAIPRLAVFPFNQNLYGDAIARTWLAHLWLDAPHVIGSFDQGGLQFGPLHLYLLALAEWLWPSSSPLPALLHAGRLVSLAAGVATVLPLEAMTRRLFGDRAGRWAVFGFAFWGVHIQCSTTSASEALNLLLVVWALERLTAWQLATEHRSPLLAAALLLNLACATRYDSWLLVPLVAGLVGLRARSLWVALWLGGLSSAFAAGWLFGNWVDRAEALFPLAFVDAFHRRWYPAEEALWGRWTYRLVCLVFWPGAALVTLTPLVAGGGLWGLWCAWRDGRARWLVGIVVTGTLAYTFRSAVLGAFVPLVRFTLKELVLLLPFVWLGATDVTRRWPRLERPLVWTGAVSAAAFVVALGGFTVASDGQLADGLRPVSPTSTLPRRLSAVAAQVARRNDGRGSVALDVDPSGYEDLTIAYFSSFPFERVARRRSPWFERRLAEAAPVVLVRWEGGQLEAEGRLRLDGRSAWFDGLEFEEVEGLHGAVHVYQRTQQPPVGPASETRSGVKEASAR